MKSVILKPTNDLLDNGTLYKLLIYNKNKQLRKLRFNKIMLPKLLRISKNTELILVIILLIY